MLPLLLHLILNCHPERSRRERLRSRRTPIHSGAPKVTHSELPMIYSPSNPAPKSSFELNSPLYPLIRAEIRFSLLSTQVFSPAVPNKPQLAPIASKTCQQSQAFTQKSPPNTQNAASAPAHSHFTNEAFRRIFDKVFRARRAHFHPAVPP